METLEEKIEYYTYLNTYLKWLEKIQGNLAPCQAMDCTKYDVVKRFEPVNKAFYKLISEIKIEIETLNEKG